jgi:hypothetical protein
MMGDDVPGDQGGETERASTFFEIPGARDDSRVVGLG